MNAGLEVLPFDGDGVAWDRFLEATPGSAFFQRSGWRRVLADEFGFVAHDLVARRDGEIVGVLPLCALPLGGRRHCWLSQPFAVEAGICAVDETAALALADAAVAEAGRAGADYVELRDQHRGGDYQPRSGGYSSFRAALPATEEEHWRSLPRRRRNMIRKARACGLSVRVGFEELDAFHDLYARSMRRLGTPVFAPSYFRRLVEEFGPATALVSVIHDGTPVAAVLSFFHRGEVLPYYVGCRPEAGRLAANDLLYWELMQLGRLRGATGFDFGRSRIGTGAWDYKKNWGFSPQPLVYRWRSTGRPLPEGRSLDSPILRRVRQAWGHVPLPLTKLLGPPLMRRFGARYT